jgi:hypothetical protein
MRRLWCIAGLNLIVLVTAGAAVAHVGKGGSHLGQPPVARAPDAGCSLAGTKGNYAVYGHGVVLGAPWALVGTLSLDGAGNLSGTATESVGGSIDAGNTYAGTYTMGADCRGTATVDMVHETRSDGHTLDLVAADGARKMMWLATDTSFGDLPRTPQTDDGAITISGWLERM